MPKPRKPPKVPGSGRKKKWDEESALLTVRVPKSQRERLKPLVIKFIDDNVKPL